MSLELRDLQTAAGGRWLDTAGDASVRAVSIDSRTINPGELFVAIRGPRFDGHDYIAQAAERGAAAAMVMRPVTTSLPCFVVADTTRALADLARHVRAGFAGPLVAITGSTGKTTTKEFAAALLSVRGEVLKTEGNLNNQFGLPLTLLRLEARHAAAVVELGMSAPGELRALASIVQPDVAVITNVAAVHLEFFPSVEAIAEAKAEIFTGLAPQGTAVLNGEDPLLRAVAQRLTQRTVWFGASADCTVSASAPEVSLAGTRFGLRVAGRTIPVTLPVPGRHALDNFLAAAAVAHVSGVPLEAMPKVAASLVAARRRGQVLRLREEITVIDDCYNSNPRAVLAALDVLKSAPAKRRIALLGDMLELGERSAELHREVGREVVPQVDMLVVVGPLAKAFLEGAGDTRGAHLAFANAKAAAEAVTNLVRPGDAVLVKGSRGVGLEVVVEALRQGRDQEG